MSNDGELVTTSVSLLLLVVAVVVVCASNTTIASTVTGALPSLVVKEAKEAAVVLCIDTDEDAAVDNDDADNDLGIVANVDDDVDDCVVATRGVDTCRVIGRPLFEVVDIVVADGVVVVGVNGGVIGGELATTVAPYARVAGER
jgi:hypothetical protein